MAIRMRRGNEADFDPSKMLPGEWAVSTDTKYVRMCFSPGIVLRMATYEAFESDMAEMRKILSECQSIQTAVELIQKNVTNSELVIENYVKEAKQYRDEAEQFRNEASMFAPEGYEDLVKNVSDNTVKIDTIIEKAELNIKNNARGSNIHLTDSAESNVVALELYGKTEQNAYTGKNMFTFPNVYYNNTGLNITKSTDGTYLLKGNVTGNELRFLGSYANTDKVITLKNGNYKCVATINDKVINSDVTLTNGTTVKGYSGNNFAITDEWAISSLKVTVPSDVSSYSDAILKIMICDYNASDNFEPYVGGKPSPSPSYPQEIKSVVLNTIKTQGKNLLDCRDLTETTTNGVTFTPVYENGKLQYINANGASTNAYYKLGTVIYSDECVLNGCPTGHSTSSAMLFAQTLDGSKSYFDVGNGITIPANTELNIFARIASGYTANNLKFYPMISKEGGEYQPYQSTEITLSEPIELNGFNGVYDVVTSEGVTRRFAKKRILSSDIADIRITSNGNYVYTHELSDVKIYGSCLCTHFVGIGYDDRVLNPNSQRCYIDSETKIIYFRDNLENLVFTDLENAKTFFDENEVYLLYELATPTTEELQSDFTALKTFYPETYVSNDADCDMSITYTADAKNYIDNKIALLTTAIYNNI